MKRERIELMSVTRPFYIMPGSNTTADNTEDKNEAIESQDQNQMFCIVRNREWSYSPLISRSLRGLFSENCVVKSCARTTII